jgi:exosortase A-associated hydrolase 1
LEEAFKTSFAGQDLFGIMHLPIAKKKVATVVVLVVGGPQTRVGSHRMYVRLARALAAAGIAVVRFDYAGLGDSPGEWRGYKFVHPSITAILRYVSEVFPALQDLFLWSLCDGATTTAVYAASNQYRLSGLILCNPYLHSESGKSKAIVRHYYWRRLVDKELWHKLFSFKFDFVESFSSGIQLVRKSVSETDPSEDFSLEIPPEDFFRSISDFKKPIRFLLSADDLTALQFYDRYKKLPADESRDAEVVFIDHADHTFSGRASTQAAIEATLAALKSMNVAGLVDADEKPVKADKVSTVEI